MLTQICQYLRNWFDRERIINRFVVVEGVVKYADGTALPLLQGQYYRIIGSVFNDGVHKLGDPDDALTDEPEFPGAVWSMAVPPVIAEISTEIAQWCADNAEAMASPYQSESFGGYSYSIRSGTNAAGGTAALSWLDQFAARLAPWRKI